MQYSIVNLSQVKENDWRLDGEYWLPEYLEFEKKIKSKKFDTLNNLSSFNARYSQPQYNESSNIKIINSQYIREDFIDYDNARNGLNKIVPYEAVMINSTGVGTLGRTNINYLQEEISVDSHVNIIITKNINPYFLRTFLQSKYGKYQIEQNISGSSGQIEIYPRDFAKFKIPLLSTPFQTAIANLVQRAFELQQSSQKLYKEAETLLLEELGLLDWKSKHQLWCVKNYSDTVKANRMDAEYFQPMYEEMLGVIKNVNSDILENIVDYQKGIEVGSEAYTEKGIDFIRISDFSTKGIKESSQKIDEKLFLELEDKYSPKEGDILFTKDGTIGLTYLVNENLNAIISGAFLKLRPKIKIESEYLTLVLNSIVCKKQIEQLSGGAIIAHLKPSDAMNLQIPILPLQTQQQISQRVIESKENDKTSKSLLETAKKAVEMAIEESEEVAMGFIDDNK